MGFISSFNAAIEIPSINRGEDVVRILSESGGFSEADLKYIGKSYKYTGEIKQLLTIAETARQGQGRTLGERFIEICSVALASSYEKRNEKEEEF